MPTVRSSVLLPDMFEPLTIRTCVGSPERDVVADAGRSAGSADGRAPRPHRTPGRGPAPGTGRPGSPRRRHRGRTGPRTRRPRRASGRLAARPVPRQASIRIASCVVQSQSAAKGHEELVPLRIEQVEQPGQPPDPRRGGHSLGLHRRAEPSQERRLERLALEPREQLREQDQVVRPLVDGGQDRAHAPRRWPR